MKKLITSLFSLSCFLTLFLLTSCSSSDNNINGYTKTDSQLYYKLLAIGDGTLKGKTGDKLLVNAVYKTQNDSVFWDSKHHSPDGYFITFEDRCQIGCFNEYFPKLV